jgi:UDP-GlcNAc:undecaprenyl-phosphate GlcNAc-1-phosphate transferase
MVDDRWGLDALTKLAGQALAAGVMVLLGLQLLFAPFPGRETVVLPRDLGVLLTIALTLVMVNSINFIDGLDGLASGVVAIAAGAFFVFTYQLSVEQGSSRAAPAALISAVLCGVCVGFLPHNFNPARIFMGDSGSMLLGLLLASATTSGVGTVAYGQLDSAAQVSFFIPLLVPLLVLAVPFIDLCLAIFRRMRAGRPVFAPDKEHLHHRLLEIGHSQKRAVLIMYFWSALIAFGGVAISFARPVLVISVGSALALVALVTMAVPRLMATRDH